MALHGRLNSEPLTNYGTTTSGVAILGRSLMCECLLSLS